MRTVAIVCNVVLFAITCIIVLAEGIPRESRYLILTVLPLLVSILTLVVLLGGAGTRQVATRAVMNRVALVSNLVLLAFSCWAAIAQYPYPEGNGVIPFAVLMVFAPIVSSAVLLGSSKKKTQGQVSV